MGDTGRVKRVGRLGRIGGKADGAAIGWRRRLAVDRFRHREGPGLGSIENAMAVDPPRRNTEGSKQRVIERLGFFQVVGSDHDMRKHPAFPSQCSPSDLRCCMLDFYGMNADCASGDAEASRAVFVRFSDLTGRIAPDRRRAVLNDDVSRCPAAPVQNRDRHGAVRRASASAWRRCGRWRRHEPGWCSGSARSAGPFRDRRGR